MRGRSPDYSPRYAGRRRSPSPRGGRGGYSRDPDLPTSLLVRNIPRDCSAEELRIPFERYGVVKDVYLPRDYYTGQPRGFGFVQYMDPREAADAQYYLDHQLISGREITVVFAEENRKKPQEMRTKERVRGRPGFGGRRGGSPSARSRSRSPRRYSPSPRGGHRSRSHERPVRGWRKSPTPPPGHHGNARSPSPVRFHRRRTRDMSPVPARRSPSPPSRSRDRQARGTNRDHSRSRSGTPAGTASIPPRRRRSPSPPSHRLSPAGRQRHAREAGHEGSPIPEARQVRPSGFDPAPRSPLEQ